MVISRRSAAQRAGCGVLSSLAGVCAIVVAATAAAAPPVAGETYVYRLSNGYNNEPRAQVSYRVDKVDAGRVAVVVSADPPSAGMTYTELYTSDGNSLRRTLTSHDQPRVFEFSPAYPAYVFPLEPGKSWSVRVNATDPGTGRRNSVRIDGKVLGHERIRVPAGEFDTVKVRRSVYAGDWDGFRHETNITEIDWYAPDIGRPVRSESRSSYMDTSKCGRFGCDVVRGDWNVYELVSRPPTASLGPTASPSRAAVSH